MSKSEREKMLAGEGYFAMDDELGAINAKAQELIHAFNHSHPANIHERAEIIEKLFGAFGNNCLIKQPFFCDYGNNIYIGDNFFANYDCVILDCNEVRIGNNVMFAPKVQIYTAYHPLEPEIRRTQLEYASPVTIGDDVWLGGGVIVCPNVEIGAGTTIGAGSVVTKSIPPGVFAAGNPCRVIRQI
ncbi:MAG: sugar O-acetyltransferase [Pyrinomonadaceae bacterium]|nr:sugar O-acetyltransferase [Pyrinomonadaceae bacterium]